MLEITDYINISYIIYGLSTVIVILILWIIRLEIKMKRFLRGKNAKSLEDSIQNIIEDVTLLGRYRDESMNFIRKMNDRLKRSIQAVETIRFNPFKGDGSGGNQSFSTAILNEEGDGVVISSLYSRERNSIFSKPLKRFSSEFELSGEEKDVLTKARQKILEKEK